MKTSSTLVTFLGKGREDKRTGYRTVTYRFPDGAERPTPLFGFKLAEYLNVDTLVVLGTSGSQWGVLLEQLLKTGHEEDRILQLMDAEGAAKVQQAMLDDIANLMSIAVGRTVVPRLIPYGKDADEQIRILQTVATAVPNNCVVHFDVTHGFRHLGMVALQAAFMLEKACNLKVEGLWYGAADMAERVPARVVVPDRRQSGRTPSTPADMAERAAAPVVKLDGLARVQQWVAALERFDATGDYGVFAQLLEKDGVPHRRADHLRKAAFYERNFNLQDAVDSLRAFRPALAEDLPGASGLFQRRLSERLAWIDEPNPEEPNQAAQQRKLAFLYLKRRDFVRAAVLGQEAFITHKCLEQGRDPNNFDERKAVGDELRQAFDTGTYPHQARIAWRKLNNIRNALAHASIHQRFDIRSLLKDEDRLKREIQDFIKRLMPSPRSTHTARSEDTTKG